MIVTLSMQKQSKMPLEDILALEASLLNLSITCYPDHLEYVDEVFNFCGEILTNKKYFSSLCNSFHQRSQQRSNCRQPGLRQANYEIACNTIRNFPEYPYCPETGEISQTYQLPFFREQKESCNGHHQDCHRVYFCHSSS